MTSRLNLGGDSHGDKSIHFLRIVLPENLLQGKLRLPPMFASKYGKYLSSTMFLKLPNGEEWRVNLEKSDDSICFQKGWNEFVKYHSLAPGHLLIFRYDGTSHFHIFICDMSGTEIEYPINKANHKRVRSEEIQPLRTQKTSEYNKNRKSNLNDIVFHQVRDKKGKNLDFFFFLSVCLFVRFLALEIEVYIEFNFWLCSTISSISGKRKMQGPFISNYGVGEAAENTFFTVIVKSNHLIRGCVYLPYGSLKSYIKLGEQYVTLLVGNSSWKVKLRHYQNKSSYFTTHWPAFAGDNDLKERDTCLFQLLNYSDDLVMKVSISRFPSVKKAIT
ncbi:hypothetical protein Fmac_006319 [Flemingia macrophylla]|uniref:TF-B3 domain-containing protein n=1 Tax=Flemingia macrophylla TaxID=520843 RepID=A0ABD1NA93_9FABA